MIGEQLHTNNIEEINKGPLQGEEKWDFTELEDHLSKLKMKHNGCNLFVFSTNEPSSLVIGGTPQVISLPVMNIIICDSGNGNITPPELVSIKRSQLGSEVIKTFKEMKLEWVRSPQIDNLYYLNCLQRRESLRKKPVMVQHEYEYSLLFTMKPELDWTLDNKGKLSVTNAMFQYRKEDGEVIEEMFDKENGDRLSSFIPDFIERHEIDGDDSELYDAVHQAIKTAFEKVRREKEKRKELLSSYPENVLNNMKVVKIYPQNDFVTQKHKSHYVNPYYGKAHEVV